MEDDSLVQEHLDLIDTVAWDVVRKCRIPERGFDEVWSASGLALVLAARKYDPEKGRPDYVRSYLRKKMFYLVIDELRLFNGRRLIHGKPGGRYEMNRGMVSLNVHSSGGDRESNETELVDMVEDAGAQLAFDKVGDEEFVRGFLASLPTDRMREIAIRLVHGETMKSIGDRFGISESRISQIVSKMQLVEADQAEPDAEPVEWGREELWDGPLSLDVSWR